MDEVAYINNQVETGDTPMYIDYSKVLSTHLNTVTIRYPDQWGNSIVKCIGYDSSSTSGAYWRINSDSTYGATTSNWWYPLYGCGTGGNIYEEYVRLNSEIDPVAQKRCEIKSQLTIIVKSRAQSLTSIPDNEWVAMQTLREMITEAEYRKYVKDGFITVRGQSGKVYQVFRNRSHTKVYYQGELVEEICVRLRGGTPPTDNVIAFKTMIEVDEESFAALGNRYNMRRAA